MKKIIKYFIIILLSISINQIGTAQICNGPFEVDLSSGGDHTIDDILEQLDILTLDELCNYGQQYSMVIGGTLILDNEGETICFDGINIKMLDGAKIELRNKTTLSLNSVHIFGCDAMWASIDVFNSTINVTGHSVIEDAVSAIWAGSNSTVYIQDATFNNNNKGVFIGEPTIGNSDNLSVGGTTFTSDDKYLGEGSIPFVGIMLHGQNYIIIAPEEGNENTFENLKLGIFVWHSKAKVENCVFNNIQGNGGLTGNGVSILNHPLGGDGVSTISNNTFANLNTGIRVYGEGIVANNNEMEDVEIGMKIENSESIELNNNNIVTSDIGIGIYSCNRQSSNSAFVANDNDIEITDNDSDAKAINIQSSDDFNVTENNIILRSNEAGVFVRSSNNVTIEGNYIDMQGGGGISTKGIHLEDANSIKVSDNDVIDAGPGCDNDNIGIFAENSFGTFECNKTHNFKYGMNFFDDCDDSRLEGNEFYSNTRDLVLGNAIVASTTVIGKQGNFDDNIGWGNKWYNTYSGGTAYNYSPDEFVEDSRFLVNSYVNPIYKPQTIFPDGDEWFEDEVEATNQSPCSGVVGPPIDNSDTIRCEDIITKITKIDTTKVLDECKKAMWKYHYYKKLLVLKKKNLIVGDCIGFFNEQTDSAFIQIAQVDSAITNILSQQFVDQSMIDNLENTKTELDNLYDEGGFGTPKWNETMALYSQLLVDYNVVLESERTSDGQKIDSVKNVITTITVSDSCLKVLLNTFEVELDYIKSDSLTTSQFTYIKEVAESCPSEFGDGVYIARSLMSGYENIRYASIEDCGTPIDIEQRGTLKGVKTEMQLYPNPTTDVVSISIDVSEDEIGELTIVDIRGKVINSFIINDKNSKFKLNVSKFANGIYLVKYKSNKGKQSVEKLMISK